MKRLTILLIWLYRRLLALYPASYRERFAEEMEEVYRRAMEEARGNPLRVVLLLLREVRDLPISLLVAYRRQRRHTLLLQGARFSMNHLTQVPARFERVAIRLQPWVWGLVAMTVAASVLFTVWLFANRPNRSESRVPIVRGTSAIILDHNRSYVSLPQTAFSCVPVDGRNQASCTANLADEVLQLTLTIHSREETGGYSGHCRGIYAGELVNCLQLFTRAKDRTMPPVTVEKPRAMTDAQWQELTGKYAFTFPSSETWLQVGSAITVFLSLAVVSIIWSASPSTPAYVGDNIWLRRVVPAAIAGIVFFFPLAWLSLLLSFGLENWIERF